MSVSPAGESWDTRTNIPRHEMQPPNESCMHISYLKFGRSDYEAEMTAWHKACNKARAEGLDPPPHWRELAGDKYALRYIYEDPTGEWLKTHKYLPVKLWCPDAFYDLLLSTPVIIQCVNDAIEGGAGIMQMRNLERQVSTLFRTEYKRIWHESEAKERSIPDRDPYILPTIEQHWAKALKFFDMAVPIIAQWLLLHYCSFPEQWAVLIARHVTFSKGWLNYAGRVATNSAGGDAMRVPSRVKRLPRGADQATFSTVKTVSQETVHVESGSRVKRIPRQQPTTQAGGQEGGGGTAHPRDATQQSPPAH